MLYVKPTRKAVRAIEVEGETMLHDPATQQVYVLNPTAALIWSLCDGTHTVEQMIDAVKTQFSQTTGVDVPQDVNQSLAWFNEYGLLQSAAKNDK
jgi:hypothetical protein